MTHLKSRPPGATTSPVDCRGVHTGRAPVRVLQPCGTKAAFRRHQRADEPIDDACRRAFNADQRESRRRRVPDAGIDPIAVERVCSGDRGIRLNAAERREVVLILTARRYSASQIAERMGIYPRSVTRIRSKTARRGDRPVTVYLERRSA